MKLNTKNPSEFNFQNYTLLIVDDTPANLGVVVDYLESYGFMIMAARNGETALKRVQHALPDIILLDVMMPGLNGFETCQRLKLDEATKDIPVIFMTALSSIEDKVKGFEVGGVDYVTKPLQQEEVLARITTHLRLRDLSQSLEKANAKLTELNATKDKFFSIVAHDLKGPFQPLLGMAELLPIIADTAGPQEIKEIGESIYRSAKGVHNLLENLLQWSRMEQGHMEHWPISLDLEQLAKQNMALLADNASDKKICLQNRVVKETFVYADENMLDTVMRNLVSNALKFTPNGGEVTISAKPSNLLPEFIEVSVSDTGSGISKEDLNKLFKLEVHHSTTGTAHEQGTGLGLIICKEMVEKNRGQIWIESKVEQGTVVSFTIPTANGLS